VTSYDAVITIVRLFPLVVAALMLPLAVVSWNLWRTTGQSVHRAAVVACCVGIILVVATVVTSFMDPWWLSWVFTTAFLAQALTLLGIVIRRVGWPLRKK
jgi:hypothetical protein